MNVKIIINNCASNYSVVYPHRSTILRLMGSPQIRHVAWLGITTSFDSIAIGVRV